MTRRDIMTLETMFMGNKTLQTIKLPDSLCVQSEFSLSVDIPQVTLDGISFKIKTMFETASDVIARPIDGGMYEIVCGWHEVVLWRAIHPDKHIPIKIGDLNRNECIALSILKPYESTSLQCDKIWLSRAVTKAKQHFKLTDNELSVALGKGYSRSTITHLVNFSRLSPESERAFLAGEINSTLLKHLSTLSFSKQAAYLSELLNRTHRKPEINSEHRSDDGNGLNFFEANDLDSKRFARDVSEALGAPTSFRENSAGTKRMEVSFYDFSELEGIASKLAQSTKKINGRVVIEAEDSDCFTPIIEALFNDDF
jgi:hypothetical protein